MSATEPVAPVIDVHHHLLAGEGYVEHLLAAMDTLGIDIVCLSGLGLPSNNWLGDLSPNNADVRAAMASHPDRIIGFGVVRLDEDPPERIEQLHAEGFRGIKTTRPLDDYDAHRFDPYYAAAERLAMPILFHTGFIVSAPRDRVDDVSSARCRPVLLDRVARTFPDLTILMAHLGMPWHDEAAQMCRYHPNVYTDLSGSLPGWRNRKPPSFFHDLFYWDGAFQKLVFGSDVHCRELAAAYGDYERLAGLLNLTQRARADMFGATMARILGLAGQPGAYEERRTNE